MTQYLKPSFTLPAGSSKVTHDEWNRIFGQQEEPQKIGKAGHGNARPGKARQGKARRGKS